MGALGTKVAPKLSQNLQKGALGSQKRSPGGRKTIPKSKEKDEAKRFRQKLERICVALAATALLTNPMLCYAYAYAM